MTYTVGTIAKALVAFGITATTTAAGLAGGPDLSVLDPGQWMAVLGAALTAAGGVFAVPNKKKPEPSTVPVDTAITAIQETVQQAVEATSELERLKQVAGGVLGAVPVLGPLAEQALKRFRL